MQQSETLVSRRSFLRRLPLIAGSASAGFPKASASDPMPKAPALDARQLGARGDGVALDTAALQKAIDTCAQGGGGTVSLSPGRYLSGTLFLKSHVTIELSAGATLVGSTRLEDYPQTISKMRSYTDTYTERSLIYGEGLEQIALQGRGVIDGQGRAFKGAYKVRPYLVRLIDCRDVSVRDVTLKDSPMWVQHYLACDGVLIDGITVLSKCNSNNDGIDIDGCHRVRIANCDIQSGDDAIVLKSTLDRRCRHVVITNCILSSDCNAFKLGTESNGGFENIVLSNCAMYDTHLAGIALEMVDGGTLEQVNISNITMQNVRGPIFIRLGNRARPFQEGMPRPGPGTLRDVSITDVQATGADRIGCCIAGLPDNPVQNVSLSNIRIGFSGGVKESAKAGTVAERPEAYPEYSMFGVLPAYGFYCRHVRQLRLENVDVGVAAPDQRPSLSCEDVIGFQLRGWNAAAASGSAPVIQLEDVTAALIHACRAPRTQGPFLAVTGKKSARIQVFESDLTQAAKPAEISPETTAGAVRLDGSNVKTD